MLRSWLPGTRFAPFSTGGWNRLAKRAIPDRNLWRRGWSCCILHVVNVTPHTYVFMDESGDPGFKISKGSSQIFCIAAVIFRLPGHIEKTEATIQELKERLGRKQESEFHFNHESMKTRRAFCSAVAACPFRVRAIVIDKDVIYEGAHIRSSPSAFYNFSTRMVLQHNFGSIKNAKVFIDGKMNRELRTYLRQQLNREDECIIHSTEFQDSRRSPALQLADMVAGSIARSYKGDGEGHQICRRILLPRLENVWDFGKKQDKRKRPSS